MLTESVTDSPNWSDLEGRLLEGGYEIGQRLVSTSTSASFKLRVLGDRITVAIVNVFLPDATSNEQVELWQEAARLQHPNLSTPLSVGKLQWNADLLPYVILRKADENLGGVLEQRALKANETREVLQSALKALGYLHSLGFVHSCIAPGEILAFGDSIQLSTTTLRPVSTSVPLSDAVPAYEAPESSGENLTFGADVWCLGATLFEVLTQKKCGEDCREQAEALPAPFNYIVKRALEPDPEVRCTLSDVGAMLRGEQLPPPPKPEPVAEPESKEASPAVPLPSEVPPPAAAVTGAPAVPATPAPNPIATPTLVSRPIESPRPRLTTPPKPVFTDNNRWLQSLNEDPRRSARSRYLAYALVGLVLVVALLWVTRPKTPKPQPTVIESAAPSANAPAPAPARTPLPGSQSKTVGPDGAATRPTATAAARVAKPASGPHGEVWRVIVYTFAKRQDAEKNVQLLNLKHPGFNPEVFLPKEPGPYLVVIGGQMASQEEASRLRQKARSGGFPHDTYVQNYNH